MMGGEGCVERWMRRLCVCGGIFFQGMSDFLLLYIVCFVLRMGGAISFLIYGNSVIYEEDKKEA